MGISTVSGQHVSAVYEESEKLTWDVIKSEVYDVIDHVILGS